MGRREPVKPTPTGAGLDAVAAVLPSRTIWFVVAILLGGALAHAAMPRIFRAMPLGNMRIEIILDALRRKDLKPEIAVFGSSVVAAAVHDVTLSQAVPGAPLVVNLSTPLQALPEAYLLYQELPPSTWLVIQQMTPWEFIERDPISSNKYNVYRFFGYRPNARTAETLGEVFGEPVLEMLDSSDVAQTFRQRWVVSRLLDVAFWLNLRATLYLESLGGDVFFFANNNFRLNDDLVRFLLRHWEATLSDPDPATFERKRKLVRLVVDELRQTGRRIVFFVPPIHPDIRRNSSPTAWEWFEQLLGEARASGAIVIDLRAAEDDPAFRDALHVKAEATERVTALLAQELVAAGLWPRSPASAG